MTKPRREKRAHSERSPFAHLWYVCRPGSRRGMFWLQRLGELCCMHQMSLMMYPLLWRDDI